MMNQKQDQDVVIFSRHVDMMDIDETVKFEWNINKELLNEFKKCRSGKVFWCDEYFGVGNNFVLSCSPNNETSEYNGCILALHLVAMDQNLTLINIDCDMELKDEVNSVHIKHEISKEELTVGRTGIEKRMIWTEEMRVLSSLTFIVRISRNS